MLCLPGLTRNARDFAELAERHSPRFRVLALEFRGRARSDYDPQPARYNPLTYAEDVIEMLDQLAVPQAIFVGTSLGGLVTMTVAATGAGADRGRDPQRRRSRGRPGRHRSDPDLRRQGRALQKLGRIGERIAANNAHRSIYTHDDWVRMAKRNCREENGEIRFDYDMAIAFPFENAEPAPKFDMWPLFRALAQKPLLVIRGERSDLLSAEAVEKMRAAAPGMKVAVVAGVGHAPELNEPEAAATIDSFLDQFERAGGA